MIRLLDLLLPASPYEGFPAEQYAPDLQGWGVSAPIFGELVEAQRPHLIVAAGTGKGGSAIRMGRVCRDLGILCEIVCVDTWLGDPAFMTVYANNTFRVMT